MPKSKSHKAMRDEAWMSRLQLFASSGNWPSDAGNRPAPRQRKWYDLFQQIKKCPMQIPGQPSVNCLCGFHSHRDEDDDAAPPAADSDSAHDPGLVQFWLPDEMTETIPSEDQRWIATELFHGDKLHPDVEMWYNPPVPPLISIQAPSPEHFLNHSLLVWMTNHLWKVKVLCPVCGKQLIHHDVHKRV
ncbi:uncharacterized protein LOC109098184 isoform X3 [Cyprinus carpio]|uniref:Uncharacterized protein LOC109098184 isoform X3 n=1 Tax=Cyprinus carpio TaxID=7962 RepID=A0A9Q9VEM7_CYPCA|nr:uncharacterized protein LOC109098184 isoform X3 [Cyprinus carpio]